MALTIIKAAVYVPERVHAPCDDTVVDLTDLMLKLK